MSAGTGRPRRRPGRDLLGKSIERPPLDSTAEARRGQGDAEHECRIGRRVGAGAQLDLAVDADHARGDAIGLATERALEPAPRLVGDPRDRSRGRRDVGHQRVGSGVPRSRPPPRPDPRGAARRPPDRWRDAARPVPAPAWRSTRRARRRRRSATPALPAPPTTAIARHAGHHGRPSGRARACTPPRRHRVGVRGPGAAARRATAWSASSSWRVRRRSPSPPAPRRRRSDAR